MATNNSINLPNGTTGQLVVGVTGAAGAYASSASADFTFTTATAGATRTLTVSNTDNSNTSSNAAEVISVGGASAGDPYTQFAIGTARSYSWGPDNSDSDILKINTGANATTTPSSGTNLWAMTSGGNRIMPLQSAFIAQMDTSGSGVNNVTGDGTLYTVVFGGAEIADQNSNFSSTTFTAPVTGLYYLECALNSSGYLVGHTTCFMEIVTTSKTVIQNYLNPFVVQAGNLGTRISVFAKMTAGDTASVIFAVSGSTKVIDLYNDSNLYSGFWGYLVC